MIVLNDVTIKYGDRYLFDNIQTTISPGERIGLVGRNGAGKSTLLKLLAREKTPDTGTISVPPKARIGYLHQDLLLDTDVSVLEETLSAFQELKEIEERLEKIQEELTVRTDYESDAYEKLLIELSDKTDKFQLLGGSTMHANAIQVLQGLGFRQKDLDQPCNNFSGGWKMRIELAKLLLQKPDYLLLDEPTNHLDIESIIWLENFLLQSTGTIVLISHDKTFLDRLTKRTLEVEMGRIHDYKANYSKFKILQAERREKLIATFENQQKEIEHKEKLIDKFRAKANKAKMAQSLIKQLDKMDRIELDHGDNTRMKLRLPPAPRSGEIVVEVTSLSKAYGDNTVLDKVDFKLTRGQKVAFVGQNGQGKSTLVKIITDFVPKDSGDVNVGYNVDYAYYAQDQAESLDGRSTILECVENDAPDDIRPRVRSILGSLLFTGEDVEKKISVLSGGERARVALAKLVLKPINLLILDEPTNHLDMVSKDVLKEAIKNYDGSLIIVSHDRDFLTGLTDITIEFRDHKLKTYMGDIQEFLRQRKIENMRELEKKSNIPSPAQTKTTRKAKKQRSKEEEKIWRQQLRELEKRVQKAENKIAKIEKRQKEIENLMAAENFYDSPEAETLTKEYTDNKNMLEQAYDAWEGEQMELEEFSES